MIYLVRHAFTPANNAKYNNQKGLYKISDDRHMPIDKKYGINQALELGEYLNTFKGKTLILTSPYTRVIETLNYALTKMDKEYEIITCEELREINSGIHYAKTIDEVLESNKSAKEFYKNFEIDKINTRYIDGENEIDVRKRVENITKKILNINTTHEYDNIFVFAHGVVNKSIYYNVNKKELEFNMQNCEVIDINGNKKFIPKTYVPKGYIVDTKLYKK